MKKIFFYTFFVLLFNGCSVTDIIEDVDEHYTKEKASKAYGDFCSREALAICNDSVLVEDDTLATMDDIIVYTYDFMRRGVNYTYIYDSLQFGSDEYYFYMTPRDDGIMYGDCEDWTITFIENNIRNGNIQKGEARWVLGFQEETIHAWTIITKNGVEYLFDNRIPHGMLKADAYTRNSYKEIKTIYSY